MGQIVQPTVPAIILDPVDRLIASNADGGLSPNAAHLVLFGEDAGQNMGDVDYVNVIGAFSLDAGFDSAAQEGSVIYGARNLSGFTSLTPPAVNNGAWQVIGFNNLPLKEGLFGSAFVAGSNVGENLPAGASELSSAVIIGHDALRYQRILAANGGLGYRNLVAIGARVLRGPNTLTTDGAGAIAANSVVIGTDAMRDTGGADVGIPGISANFNVVIGYRAALAAASQQNDAFQTSVVIGPQCLETSRRFSTSVMIGSSISGPAGIGGTPDGYVLIGANITGGAGDATSGNIVIGANGNIAGLGSRNVLIGTAVNAGAALVGGSSDQFLLETSQGGLLYGVFAPNTTGGLVLGTSGAGNRDIPGFNILKILDGTKTGVAPVGGGFLYGAAGRLHWVTPGNNDFDLLSSSLGAFTVATLPPAPPAYSRAFVTDAAAPAFAAAPVGGGAVVAPVYFDGAAWLCG